MTLRHYVNDVELTDVTVTGRVRQGEVNGLVSSAYGADIGTSGIVIDDPTGSALIKGFGRYHVIEDTATPSRVWTGYIAARRVGRGDMLENPAGRRWNCDLMDLNFLLGLRVCRGAAANRPAEDDTERVAWLMSTTFMTGAGPGIFDNGFVTTTEGLPFDEADFRKEYPSQVIDSVIGGRRTYWVYYDESAPSGEEVSLFYGNHAVVFGDLTEKLSNDEDDIDGTTVFAFLDGEELYRNPEDLYDGVLFDWKGADIYRQRSATYDEIGIHRDLVHSTDRVGSATTASTQTDRLLIRHSVEQDKLTGTVHLLPAQVNIFREGWRVQVKQIHLPGYESAYVWMTIQKRSISLAPDTFGRYEVALELTSQAPPGGPGGGDPGDFPAPGETEPDVTITACNEVLETGVRQGSATGGTTGLDQLWYYRLTNTVHDALSLTSEISLKLDSDNVTVVSFPVGTPPQTVIGPQPTFTAYPTTEGSFTTPSTGTASQPFLLQVSSDYGTGNPIYDECWQIELWKDNPPETPPPAPAQWVYGELVTMTGASGTTAAAYAPGSLHVYVDGIPISSASFTEDDPGAGTFTLAWTPDADEVVRVDYQGI